MTADDEQCKQVQALEGSALPSSAMPQPSYLRPRIIWTWPNEMSGWSSSRRTQQGHFKGCCWAEISELDAGSEWLSAGCSFWASGLQVTNHGGREF
jgi:hypothetical protein